MADQANVYVKNYLPKPISAVRYCLPSDSSDLDISIPAENEEMIYLVKSQTYLEIKLYPGVHTSDCSFSISNAEILSWSAKDNYWKVEIKTNDMGSNVPTDVNVHVGEEET